MTVVQIPDAEESFIYHGAKKKMTDFYRLYLFSVYAAFFSSCYEPFTLWFLNLHTPKAAQNHRFSTDNWCTVFLQKIILVSACDCSLVHFLDIQHGALFHGWYCSGWTSALLKILRITSNGISVSKGIFLTFFIIFMYVGVLPTCLSVCVQSTKVRRECSIPWS